MAPVFESAELVDGKICLRYRTDGGMGRFLVVPEVLKLKETKHGFLLQVLDVSWNRRAQAYVPGKLKATLLEGMKRREAVSLASLGVPIERKRNKRDKAECAWRKLTIRVKDPEDNRRRYDVLAICFRDYGIFRDDYGAVSVYCISTMSRIERKYSDGSPRPWRSVAEAKRAIEGHYEAEEKAAA